ncbi:peptide methionine sulfoxide reductase msrA/msrB [Sediminitomix flava]|uniref:Peptide methionine sulfoxide reductase MsrA n=2 Tax=Sediminitomix flava TaxID=379075 RepID=A0A315ZBW7_SEDFL|nr:peptide methionine sulfoxide reductase msrA/msrB [Sediminitomix flava]
MLLLPVIGCSQNTSTKNDSKAMSQKEFNKLTPFEEYVIVNKGTERPFTGRFNEHFETGVYTCKRCDTPLYKSEDKFASHCGWPSFDDEIEGAVRRETDADGRRTEILCNSCGAHLGHVFEGERLTDKNVRHCVNSVSMNFIPAKAAETTKEAIFASGCFWGTEYYLSRVKGVKSTTVGYTGGTTDNPSYKEVCSGNTGHAEAIKIEYDPNLISYEMLAKLFFETHDPTQLNRQGPDIGTQYRSAIFYQTEQEKDTAVTLIAQLKAKGYDVVTEVSEFDKFWPAENYHQDYYEGTGGTPYCHKYEEKF